MSPREKGKVIKTFDYVRQADECGPAVVTRESLLSVVRQLVGSPARMLQTGGGCGAVVAPLEAGHEIWITHGDVFYAYGDSDVLFDRWTVFVYASAVSADVDAEPVIVGEATSADDDLSEAALGGAIQCCLLRG